MILETKFNINDEVYFLMEGLGGSISKGKVMSISVEVAGKATYVAGQRRDLLKTGDFRECQRLIKYNVEFKSGPPLPIPEKNLFASKEELVIDLERRLTETKEKI